MPNLQNLSGIQLLALRVQRPDLEAEINAELARRTFAFRPRVGRHSVRLAA